MKQFESESRPQFLWFLIILVLVLFAGAVLILGKDRPRDNAAVVKNNSLPFSSRIYTVFYSGGVFSPTNLQINVGDTVRFFNDGLFAIRIISDPHPEHNELPGLDSISDIPSQGVFSYTFTQRGIFGYHNEKKPEQKGTIIVR